MIKTYTANYIPRIEKIRVFKGGSIQLNSVFIDCAKINTEGEINIAFTDGISRVDLYRVSLTKESKTLINIPSNKIGWSDAMIEVEILGMHDAFISLDYQAISGRDITSWIKGFQ